MSFLITSLLDLITVEPETVHEQQTPVPKNKGGRPKGSIVETAICRTPELKKLQKQQNNQDWKTTPSYIKTKIHNMTKRYGLEKINLKDMKEDELNDLLKKMKIQNVINKQPKPLQQKAPRIKLSLV